MPSVVLSALAVAIFAIPAVASAQASVCKTPVDTRPVTPAARPRWVLSHSVYDALLHRSWEVLVNCNHPQAPPRMKLAPGKSEIARSAKRVPATSGNNILRPPAIAIPAGTAVEVASRDGASASIHLSGTAMEAAFAGQPIPVRLSANGAIVRAVARGPHLVELIATAKPLWKTP